MVTSERQKQLADKVRSDLAARSVQGVWGHPAALLLVFVTTNIASRAPVAAWLAFAVLTLLSLARLTLIRMQRDADASLAQRWDHWHTAVALSCAATWGLIPAYSTYVFGRYDQDTMIVYFFHAALAVGTVILLVNDVHHIRIALVLFFVPPIVAQIMAGGYGFWRPILAYLLYMAYLSVTGRKLSAAYWRQISDNHDLAMLAHHDILTGLPNRLLMDRVLERSIAEAQARGRQVAMFYVDFDGFKQINDRYSHRVGDLYLCHVAKQLAGCIESRHGVVARIGGDEFTAVMTESVSPEIAASMADELLRIARETVLIEGKNLACTVSIGVSLFPDDARDADHLLRAADHAMYEAKTSGKNRICFSPNAGIKMAMALLGG
jgi:diguanylate cyclase (GGDEF)-like protein